VEILRFELILVPLEALLSVDLPGNAAKESDPFIPVILDQVTHSRAHPLFIIRDEHRSAVDLHRLCHDRDRTVKFRKRLKVLRTRAISDISS
jgi:hypothetical protein